MNGLFKLNIVLGTVIMIVAMEVANMAPNYKKIMWVIAAIGLILFLHGVYKIIVEKPEDMLPGADDKKRKGRVKKRLF